MEAKQLGKAWPVVLAILLGGLCPHPVQAGPVASIAEAPISECPPVLRRQLAVGVSMFEAGQWAQALAALDSVFEAQPSCWTSETGTAAYWLGRTQLRLNRRDEALKTWQKGFTALRAAPACSAPLADVFVHHVFLWQRTARYQQAADAYLHVLEHDHLTADGRAGEPLQERLRLLASVVPAHLRERAFEGDGSQEEPLRWSGEGGKALASWWRRQDPDMSTPANERLQQHLERSAHARSEYTEDNGRVGDRGHVYVRLGEPSHRTNIRISSTTTAEFWVYQHVDREANYLFVDRRGYGHYKIGTVRDLLYDGPVGSFSNTARGRREAARYVKNMAEVYGQLAIYHDFYADRYGQLAAHASRLSERWGASRTFGAEQSVVNFARTTQMKVKSEDSRADRLRQQRVPVAYYASEPTAVLPVGVRLARFLNPDGQTRVEVYWSVPLAELALPEDAHDRDAYASTLDVTTVMQNERYERTQTKSRRYRTVTTPAREGAMLTPQTDTLYTDALATETFHVGVEWNQYARVDSSASQAGTKLRSNTFGADSLHALRDAPGEIEMSDLKVLFAPIDEGEGGLEEQLGKASPYPFGQVADKRGVALYFELYNLAADSDNGARYTLRYEIERRGAFGESTAIEVSHQTHESVVQEYILLDLLLDRAKGAGGAVTGDLVVTVQVTDEVTGQTVERTAVFEML